MFKFIRDLIGKLTKPNHLKKFEFEGDTTYWVEVNGMPSGDSEYTSGTSGTSTYYPHCYRKVEQNRYGCWKAQDGYWGKEQPLEEV